MIVRIETQSRKKAKLTPYMDIMDFQLLLLTGLIVPMSLWLILGIPWQLSAILPVSYVIWMAKFKVGKPSGYWNHWLNYRLRGKQWTGYSHQLIPPVYLHLRGVNKK
jgi:hypothetical protein